MRQIWITKKGAPEVLQVKEAPDPEAGPGQVRIKVKCAGINFADLAARAGFYPDAPKVPCVVGYEVSGVIDQIGGPAPEGSPYRAFGADLKVGDQVFGMPKFGGYTDTLVLPAGQVFRMPAKMTFVEAAALPVVYLTAHHMLMFTGHLRPGSKILIHSAAGGVGLAAIQLARTRNFEIFGTASPSKHDYLRAQGSDYSFPSASAAAATVIGASANGRILWKLPDGKAYGDWEASQGNTPDDDSEQGSHGSTLR